MIKIKSSTTAQVSNLNNSNGIRLREYDWLEEERLEKRYAKRIEMENCKIFEEIEDSFFEYFTGWHFADDNSRYSLSA